MFRTRKSKQNQSPPASTIASDLRATRRAGIRTAIIVTALVSGIVPAFFMFFSSNDSAIPFTQHLQQMWSVALLTYPLTLVVAALTIMRKRGLLGFGNLLLTISIVIFCGSVGNAIGVFGGHETATNQHGAAPLIASQSAGFSNVQPVQSYAQPVAYAQAGYSHAGNGTWQQPIASQYGATSQRNPAYVQHQTQFAATVSPASNPESNKRGLLLGLPKACLAFFSSYYKTYGFRTFLASVLVGMFAGSTANRFFDHVPQNRNSAAGLAKELLQTRDQ